MSDDLFGDSDASNTSRRSDAMDGIQEDKTRDDDLFESLPESEGEAEMEVERRKRVVLQRFGASHDTKSVWSSRIPAFLQVDPTPFNAERYLEEEKSAEDLALEETSIRWKYAAAGTEAGESKVTKVSNTRIVEWSDGSRTLQIGSEHFEIRAQAPFEPTFVCVKQPEALQTTALVDETLTFLPTSTSSATHRKLAEALARKQASGKHVIGSVFKAEDPDKVRRELERAELMKERNRRKLAAARNEDEPISYTDRSFVAPASASPASGIGDDAAASGDEDLEALLGENSESEEDESRAERLQRAKDGLNGSDEDAGDADMMEEGEDDNDNNENKKEEDNRESRSPESGDGAASSNATSSVSGQAPIRRRAVLDDEDSD